MKLDVTAFSRLRPGLIRLRPWTRCAPPRRIANPAGTVLTFARYMGMTEIPAQTVEKLRQDPHFRYCFYQLDTPGLVYNEPDYAASANRGRLLRLLKDPDSVTDEDLYQGLKSYLNNFTGYLPGGYKYQYLELPPEFANRNKSVIDAVNRVLKEKGLFEAAAALRIEADGEITRGGYAKRAELIKLSLAVFDVLVGQYGFDPRELWR